MYQSKMPASSKNKKARMIRQILESRESGWVHSYQNVQSNHGFMSGHLIREAILWVGNSPPCQSRTCCQHYKCVIWNVPLTLKLCRHFYSQVLSTLNSINFFLTFFMVYHFIQCCLLKMIVCWCGVKDLF